MLVVELAELRPAFRLEFQVGELSVCWCHSLLDVAVKRGNVEGVDFAAFGFEGVVDGSEA